MLKYKIVLVPFPFDDLSGAKPRPALCLTNKISVFDHVVIAQISSQVAKTNEPSDLLLFATAPNFTQTGLKVDSAIRLHRLVTIPASLIRSQLGSLSANFHADVESKLKNLFGI